MKRTGHTQSSANMQDGFHQVEITAEAKEGLASHSPASLQESDPAVDEARLLRKVDWHLLPILFLIYVVSFLDRQVYTFVRVSWVYSPNY